MAAPAQAGIKADREKASQLAAEVTTLDGHIAAAAQRFAAATQSLQAVRAQIRANQKQQREARQELDLARVTLAGRAVALYKHDDVTPLDAMMGASDFNDLVSQLTMVRSIARGDRDVVRTIERTTRELHDTAASLTADEQTTTKLVATRSAELADIRARLRDRQALLSGVRAGIRTAAAKRIRATASSGPAPTPTTPPDTGGGQGQWWPLIQAAAAANGVSAGGMYRLMNIESGGSATAVGPGGYYGLFQYAPSTWKGSWNPYRSASITDGAAQIKATAHALRLGYGHSWWDPSYSSAFRDL